MPAGTGQSEPDVTEIRELEERLDNFRIQVSDDLTIRGSAWNGYAFDCPACPEGAILAGACCFDDGACIITSSETQCIDFGGTFQGIGTVCDPNPCPPAPPICLVATNSGLLITGATYKIITYNAGDDFTNVGAGSNASGIVFVATGTTPAVWTNFSSLQVNKIYVTVSGVTLCGCTDNGDGTSVIVTDGHNPGGVLPGINSVWEPTLGGPGWQQVTNNGTPDDPFFYITSYAGDACGGTGTVHTNPVTMNVSCSSGVWTVEILNGFGGTAFLGSGSFSLVPNGFVACVAGQLGYDGQAVMTLM